MFAKWPKYCVNVCFSTQCHVHTRYRASALHFDLNPIFMYTVLSIIFFSQFFMAVYLNSHTLIKLLSHVLDINSCCRFYNRLHLTVVIISTFVLNLMLIFILSVSSVTFLC